MRYSGILRSWNDERGFGFIAPEQGGREIFVHISALPRDGTKPVVGEKLSFEFAKGDDGKLRAVKVHREALGPPERRRPEQPVERFSRTPPMRRSRSRVGRLAGVVLAVTVVGYLYNRFGPHAPPPPQVAELVMPSAARTSTMPLATPDAAPIPTFQCDGRQYCSQMHSCKEAKFFLKNCPGTRMDGDHDGVPCEQQWCTGPLAE
ncbi:MAG TPA: cold shock domain-containing protein [Burkholderiaceae bacterium]|jgi:cold shock CspA family protein